MVGDLPKGSEDQFKGSEGSYGEPEVSEGQSQGVRFSASLQERFLGLREWSRAK